MHSLPILFLVRTEKYKKEIVLMFLCLLKGGVTDVDKYIFFVLFLLWHSSSVSEQPKHQPVDFTHLMWLWSQSGKRKLKPPAQRL